MSSKLTRALCAAAPGTLWASGAAAQAATPAPDAAHPPWGGLAAQLAQTGLALALVCALAWVAVRWLAPRVNANHRAQDAAADARMAVVERLTVGPDRELLVVRVDAQRLLLASTPGGVTLLRVLESEAARVEDRPTPEDAAPRHAAPHAPHTPQEPAWTPPS